MWDELRNTLISIAFMRVWIRVDVSPQSQTHFVFHTSRMHRHMYIDHMSSIHISMRICANMASIHIRISTCRYMAYVHICIHVHMWLTYIHVYIYI